MQSPQSCVRCSKHDRPESGIAELREVTSYDELELDTLGDRKTALFLIMSDTDDSFNFLISMCYTQLFNLLCEKADDVYGGRLPVHVRCLIDECANIGQIPKLEKLVATIRSREISACLVLQAQSQLKAIYKDNADTIIGNMDTSIFLGGKEPTNIRMGNPSASEEQVIAAAKAAQCHEFISKLPGGYHTVVGSKGIHLSGGERQRIAIARAIIKDSPIIVLDEATAFSDPENEYLIQKAFEKLMQGKTVIIIAHRLSTIRNADKIIVMEKGHLIEEGKHDELVDAGGRYAQMWNHYTEAIGWKISGKAV